MKWYDLDSLDNRSEERVEAMVRRVEPMLQAFFRPVVRGVDRVPRGSALYVANHNGASMTPDTFIMGAALYREHGMDALPYGLAHEVAMQLPAVHQFFVPLGAVRASHANAHRLFAEGKKALVYPGGDLDSMRSFRHRDRVVFGPRRGYIRLALREGTPIVPVVSSGAHSVLLTLDDGRWLARALGLKRLVRTEVWPIALSIPWGLTVGPTPPYIPFPTQIFVEFLEPVHFERTGPEAAEDSAYVEACHERVHGAMESALKRLSQERRRARRARMIRWFRRPTGSDNGC